MAYVIPDFAVEALGFDLDAEIAKFQKALDDHRFTVDVPAPGSHPLVELIVRQHNGEYIIESEPEKPVQPPSIPDITFAQLLIGLVQAGWITEAEGEAWLAGTLPAAVLGVIQGLPEGQRFAAKARALRPSLIERNDPLVAALAAQEGKTPSDVDQFFLGAASL